MLSSFFVISASAKSSVTLSSPAVKLLPPMPPGALPLEASPSGFSGGWLSESPLWLLEELSWPLGISGGWLSVLPLWLSGFAGG